MKYILIVVMLLSGCSVMQNKMDDMKLLSQDKNSLPQICCIPDPGFPHSCGGWLLCEL